MSDRHRYLPVETDEAESGCIGLRLNNMHGIIAFVLYEIKLKKLLFSNVVFNPTNILLAFTRDYW